MIGMWLMYARTEIIVLKAGEAASLPMTAQEIHDAIGVQIFGVVGGSEFPLIWAFADSLWMQLAFVVLVPGLLALVFGWLAFRSRVTGVYLVDPYASDDISVGALSFPERQRSAREQRAFWSAKPAWPWRSTPQSDRFHVVFLGFCFCTWLGLFDRIKLIVESKLGNVIRAIRDDESRVRFLGYNVEAYKLFIFVLTAIIAAIAGAIYYPQAGIINPAEIAPIASIYLAVWVAVGGRGRLYGAVIGAAFVSLLSSWFTGGQMPDIPLGFAILFNGWTGG